MKTTPTKCDDLTLLTLLQGDLPKEENERTLNHISNCPYCQQRLGELAASGEEWLAVTEAIKELTMESDGSELGGFGSIGKLLHRPSAPKWTEAMAKQLLSPPSHPEMLGRLGRYEIERLIGAGGMGLVFKAFDRELNRPLAIKVLSPHLAGSGSARQRFAREARAAAAVVHPHVVPIYNVESEGDIPYLVMQYVSGESLQDRIDREGPLELEQILRIGMQVADGLAAAHQQGLVHRDIKPSNILLEDRVERALITDFGLARACDDASLTRTGVHPGTPHYMSPEQALGKSVDSRSDLFSLGSMFYAMSTGHPPFRNESSLGVMRQIAETEPKPLTHYNSRLPEWWVVFVQRLMAKSPAERFENASEVHSVLKECLRHFESPASVTVPKVLQRTWWFSNKSSTLFTGVLFMLSFLILGFIWLQEPQFPGAKEEKSSRQVNFISNEEKHFYDLLKGVSSSHGEWFANAEVRTQLKSEKYNAILRVEGPTFNGIGTGYIGSSWGNPAPSHRISIAWPKDNPTQAMLISLAANCLYHRTNEGFEFLSEYQVVVRYLRNKPTPNAQEDEMESELTYDATWDPAKRTLICEPLTVRGGDDYGKWVRENSFQIVISDSGEIEIRNLPLVFDGDRKISTTVISRNGEPNFRQNDRVSLLSILGPGVSAGGNIPTFVDDEGNSKYLFGQIAYSIHVEGNWASGQKVKEFKNVKLVGSSTKLIYGFSGVSVSEDKLDEDAGYFWLDKTTGEMSEGLSLEKWRGELKGRGHLEAPQLFDTEKEIKKGIQGFEELSTIFPWYQGDSE
jgi:serine/threonine protein kinase